jgi:TPR repeat protein
MGGAGVSKNDKEADKWFRLAAEQGHSEAQRYLGCSYANPWSKGVPYDVVQSYAWTKMAADQGNEAARINLLQLTEGMPQLTSGMTSAQIEEGKRLSEEYTRRFAK